MWRDVCGGVVEPLFQMWGLLRPWALGAAPRVACCALAAVPMCGTRENLCGPLLRIW